MDLLLKRRWLTEQSTIGELFVDGTFECFILEDRTRMKCSWCSQDVVHASSSTCSMSPSGHVWVQSEKVKGATCIPLGTYRIIIDFSQRFQILMMHVLSVPMFNGIRIHPGNTSADTEGCLLPGRQRTVDKVLESKIAHGALHAKVEAALQRSDEVLLTVMLANENERASC